MGEWEEPSPSYWAGGVTAVSPRALRIRLLGGFSTRFYTLWALYIGFPEKKLRSKASDLTLVPLLDWEYQQDDGEWRDLKEVSPDQNIQHTFTLSLSIKHGQSK